MEIRNLHIEGFGAFSDFSTGPFPGGLVIISGRNEAGKSTILSFVNTMFFGFPDARRHERQFLPIHGGRYGGRMVIETPAYGEITIERIKTRGARFRLLDADGRDLGSDPLRSIFGGVTRELYRNVFSFSLQELQSFEGLNSHDIRNAIYGAGFGASFLAVPGTEKQLQKERLALFRPAGRKQPINKLLSELKKVSKELEQVSGEVDRYNELSSEIRSMEQKLHKLREGREGIVQHLSRARAAVSAWEDWKQFQASQAGFKEISRDKVVDRLSHQMAQRMERLARELDEVRASLKVIEDGIRNKRPELEIFKPDDAFLDNRHAITALLSGRDKYQQLSDIRENFHRELAELERRFAAVMDELGSHWTPDRIMACSFSLADRSRLRQHQADMDEAERAVSRIADRVALRHIDLSSINKRIAAIQNDIKKLREKFSVLDPAQLPELTRQARRLNNVIAELDNLEQQKLGYEKRLIKGMNEVCPLMQTGGLTAMDLREFSGSAGALKDRIEANRHETRQASSELDQLKNRLQEIDRQLDQRHKRLSDLELPGIFRGREDVFSKMAALAYSVAESTGQYMGLDKEISRVKKDILACSAEEKELDARKARVEGSRLPIALAGTAIAALLLGAVLSYMDMPPVAWGSAFLTAVVLLVAWPVVRSRQASARQDIMTMAKALDERKGLLQAEEHRLRQALEQLQQAKQELEAMTGVEISTIGSVHGLLADIEEARRIIKQKDMLLSGISGLEDEREILKSRIAKQEQKVKDLYMQAEDLAGQWKELVKQKAGNPGMTPGQLPQVLAALQKLKGIAEEQALLNNKITSLSQEHDKLLDDLSNAGISKVIGGGSMETPSEYAGKILDYISALNSDADHLAGMEEKHKSLGKEASDLKQELHNMEKDLEKAEALKRSRQEAWQAFLQEKGLDTVLDPATATETMNLLEDARSILERRYALNADLHDLEKEMEEISSRVSSVFHKLIDSSEAVTDVCSRIDLLSQRLSDEIDRDAKYKLAARDMQQLREEEARLKDRLQGIEHQIQEILNKAGCHDMEEFRNAYERFKERETLQARMAEHAAVLKATTGARDIRQVESFLGQKSLDEFQADVDRFSSEMDALDAEIDHTIDARARASKDLQDMASSDRHIELLARRSCLVQEAEELSRRWAVLSLALHVLECAKERFERENQPEVIRIASRFFSEITEGRYSRIVATPGTGNVLAVTPDGRRFEPERLSRGTAEQLYLCLRFGVMAVCEPSGQKLPVLMDDILVNFDPWRTRQAVAAISRLANERQVLFFTCHPGTARLLMDASPGAALIDLDGNMHGQTG